VVGIAGVDPDGPGVVLLQTRAAELPRIRLGDLTPELLGASHIRRFVDADLEGELVLADSCQPQEAEVEPDQPRIAVDEDDAI
jgi:hypothetical protein